MKHLIWIIVLCIFKNTETISSFEVPVEVCLYENSNITPTDHLKLCSEQTQKKKVVVTVSSAQTQNKVEFALKNTPSSRLESTSITKESNTSEKETKDALVITFTMGENEKCILKRAIIKTELDKGNIVFEHTSDSPVFHCTLPDSTSNKLFKINFQETKKRNLQENRILVSELPSSVDSSETLKAQMKI